jgi:hypothetical protein
LIKPNPGSYEIKDKRTIFSKTYQNTDGTRTLYIFTSPIHYLNKNNQYEDITDNIITMPGVNYGYYKTNSNTYGSDQTTYMGYIDAPYYRVYRLLIRWIISSNDIPCGSLVNSSSYSCNWTTYNPTITWTLHQIDDMAVNDQAIWNQCGNGALYGSMSNQGNHTFTNTSGFNSLIMTRIESSNNWIAIGKKNNDEVNYDHSLQFSLASFMLSITYTPAGIVLSPSSWNAPASGGILQNVHVNNSSGGNPINWSLTCNQNWISTNIQNGATPSTIDITVSANTGNNRTGTITFTPQNCGGGSNVQFTITQGCSSDITLSNLTINNTQTFAATNTIQTQNNVTVGSQGNLTLRVGTGSNCQIILNSGFSTLEGSTFSAYTQSSPCSEPEEYKLTKVLKINQVVSNSNEGSNSDIAKVGETNVLPSNYELSQNYPNPFNPTTTIKYSLKDNTYVLIWVYDILGRVVRTLINEYQYLGYKSVIWDGTDEYGNAVSSGIYICRMVAGNYVNAKKMLLIR